MIQIIETKSQTQHNQQIRRNNALRMLKKGIQIFQSVDDEADFVVQSEKSGAFYHIRVGKNGSFCDCWDFVNFCSIQEQELNCKHIEAVKIKQQNHETIEKTTTATATATTEEEEYSF